MKMDIICWDSSVMISHIGGDTPADPKRERKIQPVIVGIESDRYRLIVSTILYVEVLSSKTPPQAIELFERFVKSRQVRNIAAGILVARKARILRDDNPRLSTPDAIHIATAIIGKATMFHTFDKKLLALNKKDSVEGLEITECEIPGMQHPLI